MRRGLPGRGLPHDAVRGRHGRALSRLHRVRPWLNYTLINTRLNGGLLNGGGRATFAGDHTGLSVAALGESDRFARSLGATRRCNLRRRTLGWSITAAPCWSPSVTSWGVFPRDSRPYVAIAFRCGDRWRIYAG